MIRVHHAKMAARYLAHRFRELHPYEVQALLINACNLRCVYCRFPEMRVAQMSTAQWRDAIRALARLGTMRIKFQGGEPTLRKDFAELAAEAKNAGMVTAVITNGVKVSGDPSLLDDVDEMVTSLDSATPAIHDRLRGEGSHAQAVKALDVALARGRRAFVIMVVSATTLDEVEPMLDFCEARGIQMHAQPVLYGRETFQDSAALIQPSAEQLHELHRRLAQWRRQGRPLMFAADSYERAARWPDYGSLTRRSEGVSGCMAGRFYVHIEANGDVWPCHQHGADFTPKNIVRDGLEAALRHVQTHNCGDCFTVYLNERKAVFGLQPAALLQVLRRG